MTCRDIDRVLDRRWGRTEQPLPPEAADHLRGCERCRDLLTLADAAEAPAPVSVDVQARIEQSLLGSLEAVRPLPSPGRFLLGFLGTFTVALALGASVSGIRSVAVMTGWQFGAVSAVLGLGAVAAAASLSRQMFPGGRQLVRPSVVLGVITAAVAGCWALLFPWRLDAGFWAWGMKCSGFGLIWVLPAAALLWRLLRRSVVLSPGVTGATAGLLAGLAGATVVHLGCRSTTAPHLTVWHAGIVVTSALAGFALGAWERRRA
jgi:hypothetical protein